MFNQFGSQHGSTSEQQPVSQGIITVTAVVDVTVVQSCLQNKNTSRYPVTNATDSHKQHEKQLGFTFRSDTRHTKDLLVLTSLGNLPDSQVPALASEIIEKAESRMPAAKVQELISDVFTSLCTFHGTVQNVITVIDPNQTQAVYKHGPQTFPIFSQRIPSGVIVDAYVPSPREMQTINQSDIKAMGWSSRNFCGMALRPRRQQGFVEYVDRLIHELFYHPTMFADFLRMGNASLVSPRIAVEAIRQAVLNAGVTVAEKFIDYGILSVTATVPEDVVKIARPFTTEANLSTVAQAFNGVGVKTNNPVANSEQIPAGRALRAFVSSADGAPVYMADGRLVQAGVALAANDGATFGAIARLGLNLIESSGVQSKNTLIASAAERIGEDRDFWNAFATDVSRTAVRPVDCPYSRFYESGAFTNDSGKLSNSAYTAKDGYAQPDRDTIEGLSLEAEQSTISGLIGAVYCLKESYDRNKVGMVIQGADRGKKIMVVT